MPICRGSVVLLGVYASRCELIYSIGLNHFKVVWSGGRMEGKKRRHGKMEGEGD